MDFFLGERSWLVIGMMYVVVQETEGDGEYSYSVGTPGWPSSKEYTAVYIYIHI